MRIRLIKVSTHLDLTKKIINVYVGDQNSRQHMSFPLCDWSSFLEKCGAPKQLAKSY
jgi:hypothetical protein